MKNEPKQITTKQHKGLLKYVARNCNQNNQQRITMTAMTFYHLGIRSQELLAITKTDIKKMLSHKGVIIIKSTKNDTCRISKTTKKGLKDLKKVFKGMDLSADDLVFKKDDLKALLREIKAYLGNDYRIYGYRFGFIKNRDHQMDKEAKNVEEGIEVIVQVRTNTSNALMRLNKLEAHDVLRVVATHKDTPVKVLKMLAEHEDDHVKRWTGENPNTPLKCLIKLATDPNSYVQYGALIANPKSKKRLKDEKAGIKTNKFTDAVINYLMEIRLGALSMKEDEK